MPNLKSTPLIILSLLFMIFIISGCKNKYAVEIASVDSLIVKNKKTIDYLNIDLVTINERKTEMNGQISVLEKVKPDTVGLEFTMNLEKYKGIYKVYKLFIENYDVIFNRVRLNEKQLSTLKNSIVDEKISGTDFKLAIFKEREAIESNLTNAQLFGGRINQMEPDYQRLSKYFDIQISALIKQFPELKVILKTPPASEKSDD